MERRLRIHKPLRLIYAKGRILYLNAWYILAADNY